MENIVDRFIRYVKIDTQSDASSETFPSTEKQKDLLMLLKTEMIEMGLEEVTMDEYGYVMGTIPSTTTKNVPTIGFIAHVDTSPDFTGENVKPQIVDYNGGDIMLNIDLDIVMREVDFPELARYKGKQLITTDGTTLLGADDKAGVAEIMSAAEYLINNKQIEHGKIRIGFTPDEEIGRGVDYFDVEKFGAKYAYTLDGSHCGELEYETFNAAAATIQIQGRSVHPGYAKNKMINALNVAHKIHSILPPTKRPEHTEGVEGFFHLASLSGGIDSATMSYIVRNHNRDLFEKQKAEIVRVANFVGEDYGEGCVSIEVKDQYYNMGEVIIQHYDIVEKAISAMNNLGIKPNIKPVRGGTDGSRLSFMNLPCPNVFAGGVNYHGRFEFVAIETMEKSKALVIELVQEWCK